MNRECSLLGMNSTFFNNPHGLPDPQNVSTANNIVTLSNAFLQFKDLK